MNIPNLPTDNLYKFMALSGLFIFILSVFYPVYRETELKHRWINLSGDMKVLALEVDHLEMLVKCTKGHNFTLSDPDIPKLLQYRKATANLETQRKQLDVLELEIRIYKWLCWVGAIIGIVLILLGFQLWYFRVQRFQDLLLRREATKPDEEPARK